MSADFFMTFLLLLCEATLCSLFTRPKPIRAKGLECKHNKRLCRTASMMRLARLVFGCASSFQTGSDRQRGLNRGGYREWADSERRGREGEARWIGVQRG